MSLEWLTPAVTDSQREVTPPKETKTIRKAMGAGL